MIGHPAPPGDAGLMPSSPLHFRTKALQRFKAEPTKCFQRHLREVHAEAENKPVIASLSGARVVPITTEEAAGIILRYEWLGTMAYPTVASYGLALKGELLGAVCFAKGGSTAALRAVHDDHSKAVLLARGACVPHAPKNAASFLIRYACKLAHRDHGWTHFLGYSDPQAGEVGTIYKACNWRQLPRGKHGAKSTFTSPVGETITSYRFNKRSEHLFYALGWDGKEKRYDFLRRLGWTEHKESKKLRWVWEEV